MTAGLTDGCFLIYRIANHLANKLLCLTGY